MQKPSIKQYVKSTRNLHEFENHEDTNPFKSNFASIDFKRDSFKLNKFSKKNKND